MDCLNAHVYGKAPERFIQNLDRALQKKEEPMKRKIGYSVLLAVGAMLLFATVAYAVISAFDFGAHLDWGDKKSFPGKYAEVGLYKGEDNMPKFDGKSVVALYDPVDMDGQGPCVYWQGYWNAEEKRNKEVSEIDNPVFLVAAYQDGRLTGLQEVDEAAFDRLVTPSPAPDDERREANNRFLEAMQTHFYENRQRDNTLSSCHAVDSEQLFYASIASPDLDGSGSVYLAARYEDGVFVGFDEVTKEAFDALREAARDKLDKQK